jgi:hypothetical protein
MKYKIGDYILKKYESGNIVIWKLYKVNEYGNPYGEVVWSSKYNIHNRWRVGEKSYIDMKSSRQQIYHLGNDWNKVKHDIDTIMKLLII